MFSFLHFLFFFLLPCKFHDFVFFLAAGEFHCIYAHLAILSTVKGHSGCLHFLAIMYKVAMPGAERASVEQVSMSSSGTARSCGSSVSSFLRTLWTDGHSECISLHSHQSRTRAPRCLYPHYHLLSLVCTRKPKRTPEEGRIRSSRRGR